ncbi:VWA domain-containing protein [Desulfobacula sp.]|uniref:VWA domain-containing protein n=1 Tax=Desulfobacula sp. TaxID=2593537 RepID=UPI0025BAF949|nr:VWA domain-containing protein [Desulfobacula sp.]MBC2704619.1 VWA domain-containing protein [Desulfobacula sp.]
MKFANPYLLNLLWGLIPVFGIMAYGIRKRKKILSGFAKADMVSLIVPGFDPRRRWIKAVLITIGFGFAIVALAGPQLGYKWEKTTQKGVDIMIALDCSKSMLAQDIKPNRLERAKREIIDLLHMMKSDRAGLVAFAGRAILQCPLTLDHEAFNIFLKVLEPGFLPVGGTNLNAAIKTCYDGFEEDSDTEKAIIIITDGESTSGNVEEAAKEMARQGIKIFSIGVGDLQGAPIPDENGGFKKDVSGNIILSKVDEEGLEKLAAMTDGTYVRSVAGDMDLDLIYKDKILGTMDRKTLTSGKKKVWENRYQWFLFPCLVLLLIEFILSSKKKLKGLVIFVFVFGAGFFVFQNGPAYAKTVSSSVKQGIQAFDEQKYEQAKKHFIDAQLENPENATLYYNIGAAAYMNKEYDQAKKNFIQAAKIEDIKLRHDAQYNLANTDYRMGKLDDAIKGYENILKEFPEDREAKENLEFVKQKKQEQQQEKSKSDKDKDDKEKKEGQGKQEEQNQDKNQDKKEPNKGSKQDKKQPEEQNQQKDKSEGTPSQPQENKNAAPEDKQPEQANQNMENMLNRLEDKPGKAMMPVLQKQHVEKDW